MAWARQREDLHIICISMYIDVKESEIEGKGSLVCAGSGFSLVVAKTYS